MPSAEADLALARFRLLGVVGCKSRMPGRVFRLRIGKLSTDGQETSVSGTPTLLSRVIEQCAGFVAVPRCQGFDKSACIRQDTPLSCPVWQPELNGTGRNNRSAAAKRSRRRRK